MVKTLPPHIFQYLGVLTNGDVEPYTIYTSQRKRLVVFLKTWPKDPATYNQTLHRNRWRHAALRWKSLPPDLRAQWLALSKKANCTVTGYNLFIYYMLNKNTRTIETLERQAGISVIADTGPPLPYMPQP